MAQSVRVELVRIKQSGEAAGVVQQILSGATLSVSDTATASGSRPLAPNISIDNRGVCYRLTAKTNPVFVTWGDDPTATLANSMELTPGLPEVIYVLHGDRLSFIAEAP